MWNWVGPARRWKELSCGDAPEWDQLPFPNRSIAVATLNSERYPQDRLALRANPPSEAMRYFSGLHGNLASFGGAPLLRAYLGNILAARVIEYPHHEHRKAPF